MKLVIPKVTAAMGPHSEVAHNGLCRKSHPTETFFSLLGFLASHTVLVAMNERIEVYIYRYTLYKKFSSALRTYYLHFLGAFLIIQTVKILLNF